MQVDKAEMVDELPPADAFKHRPAHA